jgi:hypothetical protein
MDIDSLKRIVDALDDVERTQRRAEALRERATEYEAERDALAVEADAKRSELQRARRGALGAWLRLRGQHKPRVHELEHALARLAQRIALKERLVSEAKAELSAVAYALTLGGPLAELRARYELGVEEMRRAIAQDAPDAAVALREQELELGGARLALEAAEISVRDVREIARLLESARVHMQGSLKRGFIEAMVLDGPWVTRWKYDSLERAKVQLEAAAQIMRRVRALDPVRHELDPLTPDIGAPLRIADYLLDSFLVDLSVMTRTEDALDGVIEAQKLFADLERPLARTARAARHHAESLERRFRQALLEPR